MAPLTLPTALLLGHFPFSPPIFLLLLSVTEQPCWNPQ